MDMLREEGCTRVRMIKNSMIAFCYNEINYVLGNSDHCLTFSILFNDGNLSPRRINQWNAKSRFGRAYIGEEREDVGISFDLVTVAGISQEQIIAFLRVAALTCGIFALFANKE